MDRVLVCDDEKDIVAAIEIYLNAEGYQVLKAYDGQQALELVRREPVQLVLMDIMMPVMDGITAMTKLREISNVPVRPIRRRTSASVSRSGSQSTMRSTPLMTKNIFLSSIVSSQVPQPSQQLPRYRPRPSRSVIL